MKGSIFFCSLFVNVSVCVCVLFCFLFRLSILLRVCRFYVLIFSILFFFIRFCFVFAMRFGSCSSYFCCRHHRCRWSHEFVLIWFSKWWILDVHKSPWLAEMCTCICLRFLFDHIASSEWACLCMCLCENRNKWVLWLCNTHWTLHWRDIQIGFDNKC